MDNKTYCRELRNKRRILSFKLLGNKCIKCEAVKGLQFDHINPITKEFNISEILAGKWIKLIAELKKCQLLCENCHKEKNKKESYIRQFGKGRHGTLWRYWKFKCRCEMCKEYKHQHYLQYKNRRASRAVKVIALL